MRWIALFVIVVVAGFAAYVRLAPPNLTVIHAASTPRDPGDYPTTGSFTAVRALTTSPVEALTAIARIAEQTNRTSLLAGSVDEGMITFVTRSRVMGFPDYTTVSIVLADDDAPLLMIHGRLRFGASDLGVNRARIEGWLAQLGPLVVAP